MPSQGNVEGLRDLDAEELSLSPQPSSLACLPAQSRELEPVPPLHTLETCGEAKAGYVQLVVLQASTYETQFMKISNGRVFTSMCSDFLHFPLIRDYNLPFDHLNLEPGHDESLRCFSLRATSLLLLSLETGVMCLSVPWLGGRSLASPWEQKRAGVPGTLASLNRWAGLLTHQPQTKLWACSTQ